MHLTKAVKIQLIAFFTISLAATLIIAFGYMRLPAMLFGIGRYSVTVELPRGGGLYERANVTYRGTEIGRVTQVTLTPTGVDATLSLRSELPVPANVTAEVHSVSAIGEQYVALVPQAGATGTLADGAIIGVESASVQPDTGTLLESANRGLEAIPQGDLRTVIDESAIAFGGLGPEFARIVEGSTRLAIDAKANQQHLLDLIDQSRPVLDAQTHSSDSISAWADHLADLTTQVKSKDSDLSGLLREGSNAADQGRLLVERVQPTLPILLANLVSVGQVLVTYQAGLEQLLVLLQQATAQLQGLLVSNKDTKRGPGGITLSFNLNLNLPSPCTTGYLPADQIRSPALTDVPDRPTGDIYCRVPQNSPITVRGARNYPCAAKPGKRAPTAQMCESDEQYIPLNEGNNWKGDPNATLTGQDVPQPPVVDPGSVTAPVAIAEYDTATGAYTGPDGKQYRQQDQLNGQPPSWQDLILPAT